MYKWKSLLPCVKPDNAVCQPYDLCLRLCHITHCSEWGGRNAQKWIHPEGEEGRARPTIWSTHKTLSVLWDKASLWNLCCFKQAPKSLIPRQFRVYFCTSTIATLKMSFLYNAFMCQILRQNFVQDKITVSVLPLHFLTAHQQTSFITDKTFNYA